MDDFDDFPPISAPKIPRRKSILDFSPSKDRTAPTPKLGNLEESSDKIDFPSIGMSSDDFSRPSPPREEAGIESLDFSKINSNSQNSNQPRIIPRNALTPTVNIPQRSRPEILQPVPQSASNPAVESNLNFFNKTTPIYYPTTYVSSPRTPADIFEQSLKNTIDRALKNFKRIVSRDLSSSIRSNSSNSDTISIDTFLDSLIDDIKKSVEEQKLEQKDNSFIAKRFAQTFDDNANIIRHILSENESKIKERREQKINIFQSISNALDDLSSMFDELSKNSLNELNKLRANTSNKLDSLKSSMRISKRNLRSLKLRASEYESRIQQQNIELEAIQRNIKATEQASSELFSQHKAKAENYSQKILKEIDHIHSAIDSDALGTFEDSVESIVAKFNSLNEKLRDDMNVLLTQEQNLMPQLAMMEQQTQPRVVIEEPKMTMAQRIEKKNRIIEEGKSIIEESLKVIQENEKIQESLLM